MSSQGQVVAIVPARLASTRLPGKPLAAIGGRPMVQRVYERARAAAGVDRVLVATEDAAIVEALRPFGTEVVMTGVHATGTDRLAEVARGLPEAEIVVNVQGDLPLLDPAHLTACVRRMRAEPRPAMTTVMTPIRDPQELANPNVVKVVTRLDGFALYFSRSAVPYWRSAVRGAPAQRHIGLYAYRRDVLLRLATTPRTPLECAEELEQLRALEHGVAIAVVEVDSNAPEVDTAEDLAQVRRLVEDDG